jgi:hypothetical protein
MLSTIVAASSEAQGLKVRLLPFKELTSGREAGTLEGEVILGAKVLVKGSTSDKLGVVQYEVINGFVDETKLPKSAYLLKGETIRVIFPFSYALKGGEFVKIFEEPEFR